VDYRSMNATVKGICEETGLSSEAVETLRDIKTGDATAWEYFAPYEEKQKDGFYSLLNALLSQDELLEDFLTLAQYIETVVHQNLNPPNKADEVSSRKSDLTLTPHEMREYREYLVRNQARRLAYHAISKITARKAIGARIDVNGLEWFNNMKAEGGEP